MSGLLSPVIYLFPKSISIPVESVARAMINHVVAPLSGSSPEATTYYNRDTHEASGMPSGGCSK